MGEEYSREAMCAAEEDHLLHLGPPSLEGKAGDGGAGRPSAGHVQSVTEGVHWAAAGSTGGSNQ